MGEEKPAPTQAEPVKKCNPHRVYGSEATAYWIDDMGYSIPECAPDSGCFYRKMNVAHLHKDCNACGTKNYIALCNIGGHASARIERDRLIKLEVQRLCDPPQ